MQNMDKAELVARHLQLLCAAKTTETELEALRLLHLHLANLHISQCDADIIEKQYLTQSKTSLEEGNPYPYFEVTALRFPAPITLKDFVNYIFTRRYGWSEVMADGQTHTAQRIGSVGSYSKDEGFMKSHLIELLDEFLKWFLCQKFSHELISSLSYTVELATSYPVIRKQAFIHILEWFKSACTKFEEELFFDSSKGLIVLGLTDVWSAIRSACSSRLNAIADQFSILQLELFFHTLVEICKDEKSSWQAKEGAVMGLHVIVRRFQWVGTETPDGISNAYNSTTEYYVKFGKESLPSIPEFISSTLHDVIFLLLAHPQLSIRENAIKTFSSYLARCGLQEAMSLFNEVMSALSKGAGLSNEQAAELVDMSPVIISANFKWMDAYLAEGMLGMCIFLVKHVPPECLLPDWSLCMNILCLYLMHPASTVRQASSKVIKFIVAKDTSNPAILRLVLHSLSSQWTVNADLLSQDCLPENYSHLPESAQLYVNANQSQNVSITSLLSSNSAGDAARKDHVSNTWQWREGRLLAYELIFQFLIKNHWLYTFGAFTRSHAQHFSDDHRRSHSPASPALHELKPLHTYGGGSLQAAKASISATAVNGVYHRSFNHREEGNPVSAPIAFTRRCQSPDSATLVLQRPHQPQMSGSYRETSLRPSGERSANLPHPRKSLMRRATIDHLNPRTKPLPVPHGTVSPRASGGLNSITALPLITTVKRFELSQYDEGKGCRRDGFLADSSTGSASETERKLLIAKSEKTTLSELLLSILHQTVECFNSSSWELKRMSQQVLPCLVEILRWYDMSLLVNYWSDNLSTETSVRSYGASLSFLYSTTHAARLSPLFNDPPDNWQDLEACKEEVKKIVDCMTAQLSQYIPLFVEIIKRPTMDKLTVIAVQVLLTSSTFMPSSNSSDPVFMAALGEAVDSIRTVTVLNNPGARIQKYKPANMPNRILLPASGFLSCNPLDSDQMDVTTDNLQKYMLEHTHSLLVGFVKQTEVTSTYTLLPSLVKFLRGQYATVHTNRSFADSATIIFDKLSPLITDVSEEKLNLNMRKKVYEVRNDSFYELMLCVTDKSADKHILHFALDCLCSLLQHTDSCRYILPLCKAVCSQLCSAQGSSSQSRTCIDSLEIMSNDIRDYAESEPADDSETDDEESVLLEVEHQESLALHNSGGTTGSGRQSALSQRSAGDASAGLSSLHSEGDSGSDWDSWDEQEEETSDKETVFQEFVRKVYQSFKSQGRHDEFHSSLKKLPQSEFRLIKSLLQL